LTKTIEADFLSRLDSALEELMGGVGAERRADTFNELTRALVVPGTGELLLLNASDIASTLLLMEACTGCKGRVKQLRSAIDSVKSVAREARAERLFAGADSVNLGECLEMLPPPEVAPLGVLLGLIVPVTYEVTHEGVFKRTPDEEGDDFALRRVAHNPIFITDLSQDIHEFTTVMGVVWKTPTGSWVKRHIPREVLVDSRKICQLAKAGAPINSGNAKEVVEWLSEYEAVNGGTMIANRSCSRLGWITVDGYRDFVLPEGTVGCSNVELAPPEGMAQIMCGWNATGDRAEWMKAAVIAVEYPTVMLSLYASIASVLVEPLDAPNFVIDFACETSAGKTTTLQFGVSAWADPDDRRDGGLYSWEMTPVAIEVTAGFLHSLPLCLDETKRARWKNAVAKVIYDLANGRGRGRGNVNGGIRATPTWKLVAQSTGESSAVDFGQDAGARARTLSVRSRPFKGESIANGNNAKMLKALVVDNHGFIGREVLRALLHDEHGPAWMSFLHSHYLKRCAAFGAMPNAATAVGQRATQYVALLDTAAQILHAVGVPKPTPANDPIKIALDAALGAAYEADKPLEALTQIYAWCVSNTPSFYGRAPMDNNTGRYRQPVRGWAGAWSDKDDWQFIAMLPDTLKNELRSRGHQPAEIIDRWKKRGWLQYRDVTRAGRSSERRYLMGTKVDHGRIGCYRITRDAIDAATA